MIVSCVVAVARNGVIGRDNAMPWRLPDDLAHFKALTLGKPVIMGRLTWESLGRPLPGRHNIVVTRNPGYVAAGASVVGSLDAAFAAAGAVPEAVVIGGGELYARALPRTDVIHLTEVDAEPPGDTRFPPLDPAQWHETWREAHPADARHAHTFVFRRLQRIAPA